MQTYIICDQALTATTTFGPLILNDTQSLFVQVIAGVGVTGNITLMQSADNISYVAHATPLTVAGVTIDGDSYVLSCRYVSFVYTKTGADGNVRVVVNVKD